MSLDDDKRFNHNITKCSQSFFTNNSSSIIFINSTSTIFIVSLSLSRVMARALDNEYLALRFGRQDKLSDLRGRE